MATEYSNGRSDYSRKRRYAQDDTSPAKRGLYDRVRGIKFLVPEYAAGAIIGKGGRNITVQKDKFGTQVKMSPGRDFFPNTEERVCLITSDVGEPEQLIACFQNLFHLVRDEPEDTDRRRRPRDPDRKNQVKLLLTNNTAGLIIGRGGETIKSIQEQTDTRIMITPLSPDIDERVCAIAADIYENTLKATDLILDRVMKDPEGHVSKNLLYSVGGSYDPYGGGYSSRYMGGYGGGRVGGGDSVYDRRRSYDRGYTSSKYTDRGSYGYSSTLDQGLGGCVYVLDDSDPLCMILGIMEQYVGGLVGRNGVTISEIQAVSHTHIQISHKDEYIPGTRDRKVIIKGEAHAVSSAYLLLLEKVSEFAERRRN
ncbi:RNA-binding protein Nova-1-like [Oopsacas minuta]|uniref:RNA-binding protein Nova-1-like n=1 Tax=Oopsacas minuta TaxID=111878 RepID=A0AAV7JZJ8_9METZ|nr:RNA-binding protein Nova-1-like [Oopsacas minuta]